MKNLEIPDKSITASSEQKSREAYKARLGGDSSWSPLVQDNSPYLQVVFPTETVLTSISVRGGEDGFVRKFKVQFSRKVEENLENVLQFVTEKNSGTPKVMSKCITVL